MFNDLIETSPVGGIFVVFAVFAVLALLLYELGFRLGRWWQHRTPEERGGPTGMIVGSILALLAFLLAITMGMANDRFDARRGLVLGEANSIGTTYLRTAYLPEPASSQSQDLLREYVALRIAPETIEDLRLQLERAGEINDELWSIATDLARETPESDVLALYLDTLNETIDLNTSRLVAGLYARVPEPVLLLLFGGAALALGMVGFNAGLTGRRSPLTALVLILVLGAVVTLIVDMDLGQRGFMVVDQQPLVDLAEQIGPPAQ
jgi:hypothetical protein